MENKEVLEIKRRLTKTGCTIDRVCGCYIDAEKRKVTQFSHSFLNLEDVEFHKYLEIAKKCLSGKLGNNLMGLEVPTEEEMGGEAHKLLMGLRNSKLRDDGLLDAFYDHVIETFEFVGNYLVLLFHDVYDVPTKTSDNMKLDESDEAYEYILCAICPVALSKPGLGYLTQKNDIGARERDWVVGAVDTGFLFPAFNDRSTDIHSILCYTKNTKEPHSEFWENGLHVEVKRTASQKRTAFESIVARPDVESEDGADVLLDIQKNISDFIEENELTEDAASVELEQKDLKLILESSGIREDKVESFLEHYNDVFKKEKPSAVDLLDEKTIKNNELRIENKQLKEKVAELTKTLRDHGIEVKEYDE